ncbi:CoA ester lyase [Asticcacaulis sp. 201]|uniref:HpcH/HpaI aldolase/citrate lyase family protein n=1 Tax=Asticcacaulis sp. 201 TaxID=3028787 RepID=UPI0029162398|nr:CoA ester lyase [Asticcacaulis sp. 201]MDV6332127.1 CoA ester lyase [Asticcacaulis sp. 201]
MYRSVLFIPCANARAMAKAATLVCDALIFDLEDAVGDAERDSALTTLADTLRGAFVAKTILVRIHPQYLNAIHKTLAGLPIGGLVIPKVNDVEDIQGVAHVWPGVPLWAMIETARGVVNLSAIAALPLRGLIAGPNDLRKDLRTRPMDGRADIALALSQIVLHGRARDRVVLDGVYNAFREEAGFMAECEHGRSLGFDGKTLIHPSQIAGAEAAFSPSAAERAWAQAVVNAFDGSAAGVVSVDGEMVERLHLEQAQRILAV